MSYTVRTGAAIALVLFLTACATSKVDTAAFSRPQKLAIVTVTSTVTGLGTSFKEDKEFAGTIVRVARGEIERSRFIKIAPEKAVLSSKAFKAIKDDGPPMMGVLAPGYKRFDVDDEKANVRALAKELKVDGILIIWTALGKKESGMSVGGLLPVPIPISVGKAYAFATCGVAAFDANGNVIWQDNVEHTGDKGIGTVMGVGQYRALRSQWMDLMKSASRELVGKLETKLAAK